MKDLTLKRLLTKEFSVEGNNLGVFTARLSREGVTFLSIIPTKKGANIIIPSAESKKFFAICEKMCYNIILEEKKLPRDYRKNRLTVRFIKNGGALCPLIKFFTRAGLLVGFIIFLLSALVFNRALLGYNLEGVPVEIRPAVIMTLENNGAKRPSWFSLVDYNAVQKAIIEENPSICFASVEKSGCYLKVQTVPAMVEGDGLASEDLISTVDGIIQSICVYRGTPLVSEGQKVSVGTPLVGAYFMVEEEFVPTPPVCDIYVKCRQTITLRLGVNGEIARSAIKALAKEKCPFSQIIGQNIVEKQVKDGYEFTVYTDYIIHLTGG